MPVWMWITIAALVAGAVVVLVVAVMVGRHRRTQHLKQRFGPEYERTATTAGVPAAERELIARERLHDELDIVALAPAARREYEQRWQAIQTAFIDDPSDSLREADRLVTQVMSARGYPVADFDRRADDISVEHPTIVEDYRGAHSISHTPDGGTVDTEDQRRAFVHYRTLFDTLLAPDTDGPRIRETKAPSVPRATTPEGLRQ